MRPVLPYKKPLLEARNFETTVERLSQGILAANKSVNIGSGLGMILCDDLDRILEENHVKLHKPYAPMEPDQHFLCGHEFSPTLENVRDLAQVWCNWMCVCRAILVYFREKYGSLTASEDAFAELMALCGLRLPAEDIPIEMAMRLGVCREPIKKYIKAHERLGKADRRLMNYLERPTRWFQKLWRKLFSSYKDGYSDRNKQ